MSPKPLRPARSPARPPRDLLVATLLVAAAAPIVDDWVGRRLATHPPSPILDHPLWLLARPEALLGLVALSASLAAIAAHRERASPSPSKFAAAAPGLMRPVATGLMALGASLVLKLMIGRARPGGGGAPLAFNPGAFDRAYQSLPSSGTAVATALAIVLVRWRPSLAGPTFAALVVICAERIASRAHWPSDVFAGILLGLLVVRLTHAKNQDGARGA